MDGANIMGKTLKYTKLNASSLAGRIGLSTPQRIYDILKGKTKRISPELANKIISSFPEINQTWLLTGVGNMLCTTNNPNNNLPNQSETDNDQNHVDTTTEKLFALVESQGRVIENLAEEIRHLRAELEEVRGYSAVKKSPVDPAKPAETAAYVYIGESVMNK